MAVSQITLGYPSGTSQFIDTANAAAGVQIKGSSGTIYEVQGDNTSNASLTYLKFTFATSGNTTVGTTNPDIIMPLPASAKNSAFFVNGWTFGTALTVYSVTGGGTTSTAAPGTAITVNVIYA